MATFVVDRKTWYRGKGSEGSRLLDSSGQRCCLGFVAEQCGIGDEDLLGSPDIIGVSYPAVVNFPEWLYKDGETADAGFVYEVNDSCSISDEKRERMLKRVFAQAGDEIQFVG